MLISSLPFSLLVFNFRRLWSFPYATEQKFTCTIFSTTRRILALLLQFLTLRVIFVFFSTLFSRAWSLLSYNPFDASRKQNHDLYYISTSTFSVFQYSISFFLIFRSWSPAFSSCLPSTGKIKCWWILLCYSTVSVGGAKLGNRRTYLNLAPFPMWCTMWSTAYCCGAFAFSFSLWIQYFLHSSFIRPGPCVFLLFTTSYITCFRFGLFVDAYPSSRCICVAGCCVARSFVAC